ncbi:ABC transporter ATP-binding protein [Pollutimonas bauzanensis]|uniref:Branched-chain amino acid transport system ATP-binding protein n=1 Tax=Pollutimonas bauzanensis TaxID=658167 RepID=A0A1M5QZE7_9BURK|nr:ABC transporter ATP-binding protein [Pollutimonas bauzanensis]SHH19180.1 branched-chain amino acid transport system ATP-binding protein [Pollutimonas bauzanensis]
MLDIIKLSGGYGPRPILHDVSLHVNEGETVAILGANTAGKTSIIKAICGLLPRTQGRMTLHGQDLAQVPAHRRVAMGIACVPEGRHVFPEMSVYENLLLGGYHRRKSDLEASIQRCYELFPRLQERRAQAAGTLSGGEQQMVAIGRALIADPRLLLLDEPSHGLAPMMVDEVHSAIMKVNQEGIAVLLIEQNVASALKVVGRAYVLESGRIAMEGTADQLESNDEIRRTYLGI